MELGLATFADLAAGGSPQQRMQDLIEEAVLADELGFDVFAIGEHHREDFLVSSPAIALAAAAVKTKAIRLSSAVTVLSSDDPVRVFQDFAQVDLLSGGRAEIMAERGSFVESFPLFGLDLDDYDELYAENLDLLLKVRDQTHVTWSGRHRAALRHAGVFPRPVQERLPVWVAVGAHLHEEAVVTEELVLVEQLLCNLRSRTPTSCAPWSCSPRRSRPWCAQRWHGARRSHRPEPQLPVTSRALRRSSTGAIGVKHIRAARPVTSVVMPSARTVPSLRGAV